MSRELWKMNVIASCQKLKGEDLECVEHYIEHLEEENKVLKELNVCVGCEDNPTYKARIDKAIENLNYYIEGMNKSLERYKQMINWLWESIGKKEMRYYTNSEIRDFIRCPQFGDNCYGKWGGQKLEIRETLFHLITLNEEMDKMLKDRLLRIDKAIEYISDYEDYCDENECDCTPLYFKELLDILKGSDK